MHTTSFWQIATALNTQSLAMTLLGRFKNKKKRPKHTMVSNALHNYKEELKIELIGRPCKNLQALNGVIYPTVVTIVKQVASF